MRSRLYANGVELSVGPFVGQFVGNVCSGVAASLKGPSPQKRICLELEGDAVRVEVDGTSVPMDQSQGFAQVILRDTLRGMIRNLKGIDGNSVVRIEVEITG
jgi:hypothetical protein